MKYDRKRYALDFKREIEAQLNVKVESDGDICLTAGLFTDTVDIKFADDSVVQFRYATIVDVGGNYKLVMTEHCGYHVFHISDDDHIQTTRQ
jgi:hypothetical protein